MRQPRPQRSRIRRGRACGTSVALHPPMPIRAAAGLGLSLLLWPSLLFAQSVSQLRFEVDGDTLTEADLTTFMNQSGCECARAVEVAFTFSQLGAEGGLRVLSGRGCVDSDQQLKSTCETVKTSRLENLDSTVSITTDVSALLGSACETEEGENTLYVVADVDDQDEWTVLASRAFPSDTTAPEAPTAEQAVAGEGLVEIAFSVDEDNVEVGTEYQVLCKQDGEAVFSSPPAAVFVSSEDLCAATGQVQAAFVCAKASSSRSSVTITGLKDGLPYEFWVVAVDAAGNASSATRIGEATPAPEEDLFERYKAAGGASDGGHCFVATAAYGDYGHPQVRTLRAFRDQVLMPNPLGRQIVAAYYALSPPLASTIAKADLLRAVSRVALRPLVALAEWSLEEARP